MCCILLHLVCSQGRSFTNNPGWMTTENHTGCAPGRRAVATAVSTPTVAPFLFVGVARQPDGEAGAPTPWPAMPTAALESSSQRGVPDLMRVR